MTVNTPTPDATKRGGPSLFLMSVLAACVGLLAIDVALVLRNRSLADELTALQSVVAAKPRPPLVEGDELPRISLFDTTGAAVDPVSSDDHTATLLFVSSAACDACGALRPLWNRAAERARGSHLRVLELVLDADAADLAERDAPYPLVTEGGDAWALLARLRGVPAALLVDDSGRVLRSFYGEGHEGLSTAVDEVLFGG